MKIIQGLEQGSPEWVAFRKTKIMASMAPSIMGVGYDTPYSLWRQMLDLDPPKEITPAMQRGIDLEPEALACVEKEIGCKFNKVVAVSDMFPWLGASFDGMSRDGAIIEIKTPYRAQSAEEWWEKNEDIYYPQFQVQMVVANEFHCTIYIYMGNGEGKFFDVPRDDSYINKMIPKLKEFYDCLQTLTPPELTDKDYVTREDEEWTYWAKKYNDYHVMIKECERIKEECREKLLELSGQSNTRGAGVSVQKIVSKGVLNYRGIIEDYNVDQEKYRGPARESWRINVGNNLD